MAPCHVFCLSLAVFTLTFTFIESFFGPESGSGSGEAGMESGRVYLVAPEIFDCYNSTNCDTLASFSTMKTTEMFDITFSFISGIHKLSQTWLITDSANITFRGEGGSLETDDGWTDEVQILCQISFLGSSAIEVRNSKQVLVENITVVRSASLNNSPISAFSTVSCENVTIKHSAFTNWYLGISVEDVEQGIIDDVALLNNNIGLFLTGTLELEVSQSCFANQYSNVFAEYPQGNITFTEITCQGGDISWRTVLRGLNRITLNILKSTVKLERHTSYGIVIEGYLVDIDINLESLSVIGAVGSLNGITIANSAIDKASESDRRLRIHNVTIENIKPELSSTSALTNSAALLVISFRIMQVSSCTIKNNGVTGIRLYGSSVILQGDTSVTSNYGINGGGMAVISNSFVLLGPFSNLQVSNNTAERFGGGIYVSQDLLWINISATVTIAYCYIYSTGKGLKTIVLDGNMAGVTGHNLYGAYVEDCTPYVFPRFISQKISNFGEIESENCNQTTVSSDALKLLPCTGNCVNDSETARQQTIPALFPGQDFSLRIAAVGEQNGLTPAIILFRSDDIILDTTSLDTTQRIGAQCTTVTTTLALRQYVNQALLNISIADESLPTDVNAPIEVYVGVLPCPPGFSLSESICDCRNSLQGLATCNITDKSILKNGNSWIFPQNDSTLIFENCPFDYCNGEAFRSDTPDEQCGHNRSGILCGECLSGYSLMLGSNDCENCTEQTWQAPVIVLGSILAGIGLVAVLIGLNLTVSVGTMNGLIFFVNIVKIYEPIFLSDAFHPILQYCISWLNLDLGIPSCFISGMTTCDKVGLQFIFPLYLLGILVLITVICKAGQWRGCSSSRLVRLVSGKFTLLIGSKAIPAFATLILLSYTKLLRTTILIFHRATIITTDCEESVSEPTCKNFTVWYVDGNRNYTSACHGVLFGVAVGIFTPLVILFTSFMLFFPLMERYLPRFNCWSSWHIRLKPWYDAYGGPYKDEYRSWTGVLLLIRCALSLVAAFESNPIVNISVLAWVCLFLIFLIPSIRVYKSFVLNLLELMYLVCLLMLSLFAFPNYRKIYEANVVTGLVLCSLVFITLYHAYQQLIKLTRVQQAVNICTSKIKDLRCKNTDKKEIDHNVDTVKSVNTCTVIALEDDQMDNFRDSIFEVEL